MNKKRSALQNLHKLVMISELRNNQIVLDYDTSYDEVRKAYIQEFMSKSVVPLKDPNEGERKGMKWPLKRST